MYLDFTTSSSALGTTLLSGSSQLFILVIGIPVNIDRYILDSGVGNEVCRLWNGGLCFLLVIYNQYTREIAPYFHDAILLLLSHSLAQ